jgi:GTP-binding protein
MYLMKALTAKFLTSAADPSFFPPEGPPEFAFLGRSNVGKSSLINSLLGQKLAHVSSTPGRTRTINFIGMYAKPNQPHPEMLLVDLPGYGYAKISKSISAEWPRFIEPYLQDRQTLKLCIVLIDSNIPAQAPDHHLIEFLLAQGRDFMVVGTKSDKLSSNKLRPTLQKLEREHGIKGILPYSTKTGAGRTELWRAIRARMGDANLAEQIPSTAAGK